ncbi:hypothetical protein NUACC26_090720 [Scytonema sp. NUACC26]
MLGEILDRRYQIKQVLSAGGFGQTYLADDTKLPGNPQCVVKQLKPKSNDPNTLQVARRLFASEAQVLQQLGNHDQIPRLLAYFEENQEFFLVQEFIDGQSLSTELTSGNYFSELDVINLLKGILEPLAFVHQRRIIHRDIKPANLIRRSQDGKIVLIDFGAVKEIAVTQVNVRGHTTPTVAIGTAGYMPSEQTKGSPRLSSDIYAVGMIGIQALTGIMPHKLTEDPNTGEISWRHRAQVSPALADILDKMVRYDFRQRYQSAEEALQALQYQQNFSQDISPTIIPTRTTGLHELSLEWFENGQIRTQKILENQPTKQPDVFRIGRDPAVCDLVLSEPTVSRLHVEIFFKTQHRCFYLRSMNPNNPPAIDGQFLITGEALLHQGTILRLGQMEFRVSTVSLNQYPPGYVPNPPSSPYVPPQQQIPSTRRPPASNPQEPQHYPPPSVPPQYRQEIPAEPPQVQQSYSTSMQNVRPHVGWKFWLKWLSLNLVGFMLSVPVGIFIFKLFFNSLLARIAFGFMLGLSQWVALQGVVNKAWVWGLLTGGAITFLGRVLLTNRVLFDTFLAWLIILPLSGGILLWSLRRANL